MPVNLPTMDLSILTAYYNARAGVRGGVSSQALQAGGADRGPDVEAPWDIPKKDRPIASKMADLRGVTDFIDLDAASVKAAGENVDFTNLFAAYNALSKLRVLAEYASDDMAASGILGGLNERFQSGLSQISEFLKEASFDEASLLFGEKSDTITSRGRLGEHEYSYVGGIAHVGTTDEALSGINGDEVFTISLEKGTDSDDIVVDLSEISGDITLQSIVDLANSKIQAITDTDAEGNTVERYRTRLTIESDSSSLHHLKVRSFAGETVSLSAAASEPSLVIAGTTQKTGLEAVDEGFLTTIEDLDSADPTARSRTTIAATQAGQAELAAKYNDEDGEDDGAEKIDIPPADTRAESVALDSNGNSYVVGTAEGDFGGQFYHADTQDTYLSKYDAAGNLQWTRLLGADSDASAYAVTVDKDDNVIVAGGTTDNLTTASVIDSADSFVTKYSSKGEEVFTHQVQAAAADGALSVTTDANGDILVSGHVSGAIDANAAPAGGRDAYVSKLSGSDGSVLFTHQYGTGGLDEARSVAVAGDGNLLVLSEENGAAVLRKLDAADPTSEIFSVNLGSLGTGEISGLTVDGGAVYISGATDNASFGGGTVATAHHGGTDGFVVRIDDNGSSAGTAYTSFIGTTGADRVNAVTVENGSVYAVGETAGGLNGETQINSRDAFAVKLSGTDGSQTWTHQFGNGLGLSRATGVAVDPAGQSILSRLGLPDGEVALDEDRSIVSQTSVRPGDSFYLSINGGLRRRVTIDAGDTFTSLASQISRLSFLYVDAASAFSDEGPRLEIEALRGATIDILAGDEGRDALKGLGIEPTKIIHDESANADDEAADAEAAADPEEGGLRIYGLELNGGIHLRDKKAAEFAMSRIDQAMATIRRAFREINPDPTVEALKNKKTGPVPPRIQAQINNYQAGLRRLTSGSSGTSGLLL